MRKIIKILVCIQLLWSSNVWAQNLKAYANRTEVPQGETFILTLETDDDKTSDSPDLSVLEKDFNVYSVGSAFQSSYVNGKTSHSRQWQIVLMPKNSGKIEIPAIKVGSMQSEPIVLNVASAQLAKQAQKADETAQKPSFAVDSEIDNKNPYVQQQVNYSFKIYDTGGLNGDAPVLMDNGHNDWVVKSLGSPEVKSKVINGRQLREITFKYALFPQKSGILKTPEFEFNGYYLTRSRRGSEPFDDIFNSGFFKMGFTDMFATRNPVVLRTESIDVEVKPVPAANGGYWWLPASQVSLSAEWENKNPIFRVGEAVSRSVYLKASGVMETQLPDVKFEEIAGAKQYPENPVAMSSENNGTIISVKKFSNVYIPEQSGEMIIPEVSIDWFNTHSGKIEKAILPAQKVMVFPAVAGAETSMTETSEIVPIEPKETDVPVSYENSQKQINGMLKSQWLTGLWIALAFVLGLLFSYLLFGRRVSSEKHHNVSFYVKQIEKNARREDYKALRNSLLEWAKAVYSEVVISNLDDVTAQVKEKELKEQIEQIGTALYSPKKSDFKSDAFIKAFQSEMKKQKKNKKKAEPLPKLYK
ncbi:MAG: protein BatD [Alphaproteobacteria bacterium]|nr:protein BatD [Alphaproteobacteria bacterium]